MDSCLEDTLILRSSCWKNISVWSRQKVRHGFFQKTRYKDVQLICDVSGFVGSRSLVAVLGPSGAGKTTLLSTISCRLTTGVEGKMYVNGDPISQDEMVAMSGFVAQSDLEVDYLTVFEHMYFMATLKMDKNTLEVKKSKTISSLLNMFGLDPCTGTFLKDLSGGQRKRLSIAVEMLTNPRILFCDEPTTGLDSSNAAIVVNILKEFSSRGNIVICSIHQPASSIYEMFDDVLLLGRGGRAAYFGPVIDAVGYFESLSLKCPPSYNVAEFFMKLLSAKDSPEGDQTKSLSDVYQSSSRAGAVTRNIELWCSPLSKKHRSLKISRRYSIKRVGLIRQLYCLLWRIIKKLRFHYHDSLLQICGVVYLALIASVIFARVLHNKENNFQNIRGYMTALVNECTFGIVSYTVLVLPLERPLVLREMDSGLYSMKAYYLSRIIYESIQCAIIFPIFVTISKQISDVFDPVSYIDLFMVFYLDSMACVAFGYLLCSIFYDESLLIMMTTTFLCSANVVSGAYVNISSLPVFLRWVKYLSLFYYGLQAITVLEFGNIDLYEMKRFNVSVDDPEAFRYLKMVASFGFTVTEFSLNLYILSALVVGLNFIAYLILSRRCKGEAVY